MNDEPKSIWRKSWKGPSGFFFFWLLILVAAFVIIFSIGLLIQMTSSITDLVLMATIWASVIAVAGFLIGSFIRWVCHWRNFRRFLFGLACFVTLIALFYAEEDWRGKHDWEAYKRAGAAKGEHYDMAGIAPSPVPDDQNFAMSPVWIAEIKDLFQNEPKLAEEWYGKRIYSEEVSNLLTRLPVSVSGLVGTNWVYHSSPTPEVASGWATARMISLQPWQSYYRELERTNPDANIPTTPQPQSPAADVLLALSKFDPVIEKLRQDSTRPYSRFPLEYNKDNPADIWLSHLATVKRYAQVLHLRAIAELQDNQSEKSLADIRLMLRLSDSIQTEPILISHLVRIAIVNLALQPVWEGLEEHKWSDKQLAELSTELAGFNFLADYKLAIRGERNCNVGVIEFLQRQNLRHLRETFGDFGENEHSLWNLSAILYYLCPNGWFYQNELHICQFYENWYLPLVNEKDGTVSPAAADAVDDAVGRELSHRTADNFFELWLLPALGNAVKKFAYAQESVDLARVAVSLERYRLAHGEYPESLDAVAPQFIDKLPHDIINAQPLHYRRTAGDQFILYSVGWNETDDGGVVVLDKGSSGRVDFNHGDWVWRSSAVRN
ncbi:MAG TPA: hypothetical protein VMJ12_08745 [Candidatus Acidoferrales bacterium]|nr:hypothetical protein [Candidatus Acidoferrales bacterium]